MSTSMTVAEREAFLADLHVGVLGVTTESGCLAVPIWYTYEPGGDLEVIMNADSIKGRALTASRRFSLCAQTETVPYQYVTVEGSVSAIEECPPEKNRAMAHRYLGAELGDAYVAATTTDGVGALFRLTPERWYTVDFAKAFG